MGFGGGGSSGGGGSTGTVDYPAYMKTVHGLLLDNAGVDTPANSVVDALNAAYGNSPFTGLLAYDPDTDITAMETPITTLSTAVSALDWEGDYDDMLADAVEQYDATLAPSATYITDKIEAYTDDLNNIVNSKHLPLFRAGMRDIGAVMTSAFTLGQAVLLNEVTRQVAKFSADIYLTHEQIRVSNIEKAIPVMVGLLTQKVEYLRVVAALTTEQKRIKIVAKDAEEKRNTELDALDAKWDLELFQYPSNTLAGIAGAVSAPRDENSKNYLSSGLSGALSGAAMGAMAGAQMGAGMGPWGAGIGAAIGLGAGLLK